MSNIAEGFERSGTGEFAQFLPWPRARPVRSDHTYMLLWTSAICPKMNLHRSAAASKKLVK
ncbi:MAG TPA: hypothetical protein VGO73_05445 [Pyrinomonadaceae bacterium]|nr:hypothetical protein [Pyrinomonadaceae bacterium]